MKIATWNVQDIAKKYTEIEEQVAKQNIDILSLLETKKRARQ